MAFTDSLSLGPAPAEEDPVQLGEADYASRAFRECRRYIEAIRKVCGEEPEGAQLRMTCCLHDFGQYYDVEIKFDGNNEAAAEYAYKVESKSPATWNEAGMGSPPPKDSGKVYTITRTPEGVTATVTPPGGEPYPLPLRLDLRHHSPDGFEFGYGGSGPAQLALALCADALGSDRLATQAYHKVKFAQLANRPVEAFTLIQAEIISATTRALER